MLDWPTRLREFAEHLEKRPCAPSLDGYDLVDGLRAAADLLSGSDGPKVHPNQAADGGNLAEVQHVALANLMGRRRRRHMTDEQLQNLIRAALRLMVREWYDRPGNSAGGLLHAMLDDGNFEDRFVEIDRHRVAESGDNLAIAIVDAVSALPESERDQATRCGEGR